MKANALNSISIILLAIISMIHTDKITEVNNRIDNLENQIVNEVNIDED